MSIFVLAEMSQLLTTVWRFLNKIICKACTCTGMLCGTHFLWYSVQLVEGVYATSSVEQNWQKVYEPAEGQRGGTERKKENNNHLSHCQFNITVPKVCKQVKFSVNIKNSYSHSSMLLLLSVWYSFQVYTHSSNEEVYARFCCPLAAIYMKSTVLVTCMSLKCLNWPLPRHMLRCELKFSALYNRRVLDRFSCPHRLIKWYVLISNITIRQNRQ